MFSGVATIIASYYLGKSIGGRQLGILVSILVATSPIVINYARSYHFALPATAVITLALLALARSDRFLNIKWALIFGLCVGLMPLTRTMTLAFVPALVIAATIQAAAKPESRQRRLVVLSISIGLALFTAGFWLIPNGSLVLKYLTDFGYGSRSIYHGMPQQYLFGYQNFIFFLQTIAVYVYLPNFLLIVTGFALLSFRLARMLVKNGVSHTINTVMNSKVLPPVLLIFEGTIALASSQNKGSAFIAPLVPAMLVVSTWGILSLWSNKSWNFVTAGLVILIATLSCLPLVDLRFSAARPWTINVPFIGEVSVTDGRGTIQKYEAGGAIPPAIRLSRLVSRRVRVDQNKRSVGSKT